MNDKPASPRPTSAECHRRRFRVSFAWYDLWVGVFYDQRKRIVYVCPLPCVLLEWHRA
jgi:hypothetical protein